MTVTAEPLLRRKINDRNIAEMARSPFSKLEPVVEREVRREEVTKDERLERLTRAWLMVKVGPEPSYRHFDNCDHVCDRFLEALQGARYTNIDINRFLAILPDFPDYFETPHKAGLFLSILINNGEETNYIISTRHLPVPLNWLCFKNKKNVTIEGDSGDHAGSGMSEGSLRIKGDAGWSVASYAKGGTIVVEGNAGEQAGAGLDGASLEILGDAGDGFATQCKNGEVILRGNAANYPAQHLKGGRVEILGDCGSGVGAKNDGGIIIVHGNAGVGAGSEMISGWLTIKGNAGNRVATMLRGGLLTVEGNARNRVCEYMKGGLVIVKGDVGDDIGYNMEGGELRIYGMRGELPVCQLGSGTMLMIGENADIFHKDQRVWPPEWLMERRTR